jgi:RHS repeat-associated protein
MKVGAATIRDLTGHAEGRVFRLSYDAQGRLLAATNAAGDQVVRNIYDAVGNHKSREDGSGRVTEYDYDVLNRRTGALYQDGTREDFGYDAVGNLLSASNSASRLSFGYDAMNRLTSSVARVSSVEFQVSHSYDLGGLVTNVTYPGGLRVRYGYDADGRVTNVTDWAGRAWTFTRDAAGRMTALACPNGVSGSWTHDANHKLSGWSYTSGSPIAGRTITRDEAGVKTKEQVTTGLFPNPQSPRRSANVFDAADRLTSATVAEGTNMVAENYRYDGNGALTNRQSAAGDSQYEYDCAGRLTYSLQSAANSIVITYDALGNRLTTYSANTTRIWITDHADPRKRPLMETDSNGVPVRYYIWGGGLLLAVVEADGTMRYCHNDEQGSVVALTDDSGAVTDQYCYGPYGTDWGHTGTNSISFLWLGSHGVFNVGGSALHLTRFRAYDSNLGRFLSQDPIGLGGGPNLYAYCMGSPLAYIDPLGLGGESLLFTLPNGQQIQYPPGVDINGNIEEAKHHLDPRWFYNQVKNNGPWDYKQQGSQYQEFGNFNYGATGSAFGFPTTTLLREAGRAQQSAGTSKPEWGNPGSRWNPFGGSGSYGDDPADAVLIQQGVQYYQLYQQQNIEHNNQPNTQAYFLLLL